MTTDKDKCERVAFRITVDHKFLTLEGLPVADPESEDGYKFISLKTHLTFALRVAFDLVEITKKHPHLLEYLDDPVVKRVSWEEEGYEKEGTVQ